MSILKDFYYQNKLLIYILIGLFITLMLSLITNLVANFEAYNNTTALVYMVYSLSSSIYLVSFLASLILSGILIIINTVGKRRSNIIRYYGKTRYLKYIFFITLILSVYILFITLTNDIHMYLKFNYSSNYSSNIPLLTYYGSIYELQIMLVLIGILYAILNIKELVFNTKIKYVSKKKKFIKVTSRILKYILLGLFVLMAVNTTLMTNNYVLDFSYNFYTVFIRTYIDNNLVTFIPIVATFILIIIDYIQSFKDDVFL